MFFSFGGTGACHWGIDGGQGLPSHRVGNGRIFILPMHRPINQTEQQYGWLYYTAGVRLPVILYKEGDTLNQLVEYVEPSEDGNIQNVEIRIPGHLVSSVNRKVRSRQLWGSDIYTSDSDLVAVLMHCGYIHHTST